MSTTNTKKTLTNEDIEQIYDNIRNKKQVEVKPHPRMARRITSVNNGTHIENVPRQMSDLYIVDTGTYQNNVQQIGAMRNAGLALAVMRQQILYGQDLELASPMTRIRYAEKIEILEESKRLSAKARSIKHREDEMRKAAEKQADFEDEKSKISNRAHPPAPGTPPPTSE